MEKVQRIKGEMVKKRTNFRFYKLTGWIMKFQIVSAEKTMLATTYRGNISAKSQPLSWACANEKKALNPLRLEGFGC